MSFYRKKSDPLFSLLSNMCSVLQLVDHILEHVLHPPQTAVVAPTACPKPKCAPKKKECEPKKIQKKCQVEKLQKCKVEKCPVPKPVCDTTCPVKRCKFRGHLYESTASEGDALRSTPNSAGVILNVVGPGILLERLDNKVYPDLSLTNEFYYRVRLGDIEGYIGAGRNLTTGTDFFLVRSPLARAVECEQEKLCGCSVCVKKCDKSSKCAKDCVLFPLVQTTYFQPLTLFQQPNSVTPGFVHIIAPGAIVERLNNTVFPDTAGTAQTYIQIRVSENQQGYINATALLPGTATRVPTYARTVEAKNVECILTKLCGCKLKQFKKQKHSSCSN